MEKKIAVVILAAGLGTRMKSGNAKVLHEIQNRPMILYVVETARKVAGDDVVVVIGNQAEKVRKTIEAESQDHIPISASIGIAAGELGKEIEKSMARLIRAADNALYAAKKSGKNRVMMAEQGSG